MMETLSLELTNYMKRFFSPYAYLDWLVENLVKPNLRRWAELLGLGPEDHLVDYTYQIMKPNNYGRVDCPKDTICVLGLLKYNDDRVEMVEIDMYTNKMYLLKLDQWVPIKTAKGQVIVMRGCESMRILPKPEHVVYISIEPNELVKYFKKH